jgi:hypothetical protein
MRHGFSRHVLLIFFSLTGKWDVVNSSHDEEQQQHQKRTGSPTAAMVSKNKRELTRQYSAFP